MTTIMKRPGFTLIELLVVIAIIAILASILFPVFARARAKGAEVTCLSNMKQVGIALAMYQSDSNGTWSPACTYETAAPPPGIPYNAAKWWIGWDNNNDPGQSPKGDMTKKQKYRTHEGLIDKYLKSDAVKKCPASEANAQMILCGNMWYPALSGYGYSQEYGPFSKTLVNMGDYWLCRGVRESEFEGPSYTILAWEHWFRVPVCNFLEPPKWINNPPQTGGYREHFQFVHYDGANVLWADQHAKRMTYDRLRRPMFSVKKSFYPAQ